MDIRTGEHKTPSNLSTTFAKVNKVSEASAYDYNSHESGAIFMPEILIF